MRNWPSLSASIPSNSSSGLIAGALSNFTGVRTGTAAGIERPAGRNDTTARAGWFSERASAAARASGDAGATIAPGMGAFFPVGTFASLTGAGGGGGGAASATTGVGSAGGGAATASPAAGAALAEGALADAFGGFVASAAGGATFTAGVVAEAALAGATAFAGTALADAALAGSALVGAGLAGAGLAGAVALTGVGLAAALADEVLADSALADAVLADAALAGAAAVLAGTAFTGDAAGAAFAAVAFGAGAFDCLAMALAGGATALADACGFAVCFAALLVVRGDFMVVGDADRVGEGAVFALVTLAEARFTGTAVFAGTAVVALVPGLAFVVFDEVGFLVAGAACVDSNFFEGDEMGFVALAAAFVLALLTAPFPAVDLRAAALVPAFGAGALPGFEADGFPDLDDDGPPPLPANLATVLLRAGAALFATADFAGLRAGIDFDDAATMYSR